MDAAAAVTGKDSDLPTSASAAVTGEMDDGKVILAYNGDWLGCTYRNGTESLVFWPLQETTFPAFIEIVHTVIGADQSIFRCALHCLVPHEGSQLKWRILSERDLARAAKMFETPKFFVTLDRKPPSPLGGIDGCVGCRGRGCWVEKVREIVYDNLGWEEDEYFIPEEEAPLLPGEGEMIGDVNELVLRSRTIAMGHAFEEWWPRVLSRLPGLTGGETAVEAAIPNLN